MAESIDQNRQMDHDHPNLRADRRSFIQGTVGVAAAVSLPYFVPSRNTEAWKEWRKSDNYAKWVAARAPAVVVRRRLLQMLGSKEAVRIACSQVAQRFLDRPGGYTRIMRLATPRLGDAGTRAILEFVGRNDRVQQKSEKPQFGESDVRPTDDAANDSAPSDENASGSEPVATGEKSDD